VDGATGGVKHAAYAILLDQARQGRPYIGCKRN
jgi:hypothetical protein